MAGSSADRKALFEVWRRRLNDAELQVKFAEAYVREVQQDFAVDDTSADGTHALAHAVHSLNFALANYNRVQRVLMELIDGKTPDENE